MYNISSRRTVTIFLLLKIIFIFDEKVQIHFTWQINFCLFKNIFVL